MHQIRNALSKKRCFSEISRCCSCKATCGAQRWEYYVASWASNPSTVEKCWWLEGQRTLRFFKALQLSSSCRHVTLLLMSAGVAVRCDAHRADCSAVLNRRAVTVDCYRPQPDNQRPAAAATWLNSSDNSCISHLLLLWHLRAVTSHIDTLRGLTVVSSLCSWVDTKQWNVSIVSR